MLCFTLERLFSISELIIFCGNCNVHIIFNRLGHNEWTFIGGLAKYFSQTCKLLKTFKDLRLNYQIKNILWSSGFGVEVQALRWWFQIDLLPMLRKYRNPLEVEWWAGQKGTAVVYGIFILTSIISLYGAYNTPLLPISGERPQS